MKYPCKDDSLDSIFNYVQIKVDWRTLRRVISDVVAHIRLTSVSFHAADMSPQWEMAALHRADWPAMCLQLLCYTAAGTLRSSLGSTHMENEWEHEVIVFTTVTCLNVKKTIAFCPNERSHASVDQRWAVTR